MILLTLYTIDNCIYCAKLKARLAQDGFEFRIVNSPEWLKENGFETAPQLFTGTHYLDYYQTMDLLDSMKDIIESGQKRKEDRCPIFLSNEFLSKYPSHPAHMNQLGLFVFYRTYARFLPQERRRETWKETVARAVEYNVSLDYIHRKNIGIPIPMNWLVNEAEELFDNVFNLRQFLAGRTFWLGGTDVAKEFPMANFNCSFTNIEKWEDLSEMFYLLMLGSGVGFKCTKAMAMGLDPIRVDTKLVIAPYNPVPIDYRLEDTSVKILDNGYATIYVGDSKEGWRDSLSEYITLLTDSEFEYVHTIKVSFNSVRPRGERLKRFGGTASGPIPLMEMFQGIDNVLKNRIDKYLEPIISDKDGYGQVRPIHILDIANMIGSNVVAGGVRRTAELCLFDADDYEVLFAKYGVNGFWTREHFEQHAEVRAQLEKMGLPVPPWFDEFDKGKNMARHGIDHRRLSNNSIAFMEKPSDDFMDLLFLMIKLDAEPGFINMEEAGRRRPNMQGVNPCAEILLDNKQQCNLTTVNMVAFAYDDDHYDLNGLIKAQELSARAGLRMSLVELEMPEWDVKNKRDRLIGCSMAGTQDAIGNKPINVQREILSVAKDAATNSARDYAHSLRVSNPLLVTCEKPDGTLGLVAGGVSPGVHDAHSPYFIRRIRISADDALAKAALEFGWTIHPEIGTPDNDIKKARTLVIDFPIKSGATRTKDDVGAIEQLNRYLMFQRYYTDHNSSNTITVRPEEWDDVRNFVKEHWDEYVGVTFLALDGGTYQLAPYEAITKEQYEELIANFTPFDPTVLQKHEVSGMSDLDVNDPDCATGACPVR